MCFKIGKNTGQTSAFAYILFTLPKRVDNDNFAVLYIKYIRGKEKMMDKIKNYIKQHSHVYKATRSSFGWDETFAVNKEGLEELRPKANVNIQDAQGRTPLMKAAQKDHIAALLEAGADVWLKDNDGRTAFDYAYDAHQFDKVRQMQPDVVWTSHKLFGEERLDYVEFLLEQGADPNYQDEHGTSVLAKVCDGFETNEQETPPEERVLSFCRERAIATRLIEKGADVNLSDKKGVSPLMRASKTHRLNLVAYLVQNGADANAVDCRGFNALVYAAENIPYTREAEKTRQRVIVELIEAAKPKCKCNGNSNKKHKCASAKEDEIPNIKAAFAKRVQGRA